MESLAHLTDLKASLRQLRAKMWLEHTIPKNAQALFFVGEQPKLQREDSLFGIPLCRLQDAIRLYAFGCYPLSHPLSGKEEVTPPAMDASLLQIARVILSDVGILIKDLCEEEHRIRVSTPEGREALLQEALLRSFVLLD